MGAKFNFILIDDDNTFIFLSQRILEKSTFAKSIVSFTSANEALIYIKNNPNVSIDKILLDIRMPEMDGFEFLKEFTKLNYTNTDVYMLTSSLDNKDKERAYKFENVKGFYSKPLSKDILLEICEK